LGFRVCTTSRHAHGPRIWLAADATDMRCGIQRKEIGTDGSWQVEYLPGRFERIHHVRSKCACAGCESNGDNPQMETAAKAEMAIDKGMAGPGLLAYIVTSKFGDYLPSYRLEDIFQRQGLEISRATQSVWCGDIADLAEPLYELMAERVRASHVVATDDTIMPMLSKGKTTNARMWVYVGDDGYPYNVFDFTLNRGRDGPKYFLKDYRQVLLADAYGGYNGVVGRGVELRAEPVGGTERVLLRWSRQHRQQRLGARDEAGRSQSQHQPLRWQSTGRQNSCDPGQPDQYLPPARCRPAAVSHQLLTNLSQVRKSEPPNWLPDKWKQLQTARTP
jgi:transposase